MSQALPTVAEAQGRLATALSARPAVAIAAERSAGCVLAEPVMADRDEPPLALSAMDGFAVRSADTGPGAVMAVEGSTVAGEPPGESLACGTARRVMTGAPLPPGADAVCRFERAEVLQVGSIRLDRVLPPGTDLRRAASERRAGDAVLEPGCLIGPVQMSLLAGVGWQPVLAHPRPRVAVGTTGDEVVPGAGAPLPWQVRNSNGPLLNALVRQCGGDVTDFGILPDDSTMLRPAVERAVAAHDVLVLSGGVSRGDRDLVPAAFRQAGLRTIFHGVAVKPSKPVLCAADRPNGDAGHLAFGLPGNPVATLVGFLLFVWPALRRLAGRRPMLPLRVRARLAADVRRPAAREEYRPARLEAARGGWRAHLLPPHPTADLAAAADAAGFAALAPGGGTSPAGTSIEVLTLPDVLDRLRHEPPVIRGPA